MHLALCLGNFTDRSQGKNAGIISKRRRGILWDANWIDFPCVWSSGLRKLCDFDKEPCAFAETWRCIAFCMTRVCCTDMCYSFTHLR